MADLFIAGAAALTIYILLVKVRMDYSELCAQNRYDQTAELELRNKHLGEYLSKNYKLPV